MANLPRNNRFPTKTRALHLFAVIFALTSMLDLASGHAFFADDPDAKEKAAAEAPWQLPPPPLPENLMRFYVSQVTRQSFAIDAKSLTVDVDGVIRYTMVSTSSSGAKNVSYEGLRCSSHEKRLYALGHADGTWAHARNSEWEPIAVKGANLQHAALVDYYFCKDGLIVGKADKILDAIRYNRVQPSQL